MFQQIGQKAASGFSDPIGMMEDCHQRIRFFLSKLVQAAEIPRGGVLGPEESDGLRKALVYFQEAAPRHTADEEESLFPRLRGSHDPCALAVAGALDVLEQDHAHADRTQAELETLALQWLEQGHLAKEQTERWRELVEDLSAHYERHIGIEESEVFTAAKQVLSPAEKREIGREMAARRGRTVT